MLPPGCPQGLSLLATPAVANHGLDPIVYGYQSGPGMDWSLQALFGRSNLDFCPCPLEHAEVSFIPESYVCLMVASDLSQAT